MTDPKADKHQEACVDAWTCSQCGSIHAGVPDSYGYEAPWQWRTVPERERQSRCFLNEDYCVIDDKDFFVRGCLEIPIIGREDPLLWGVWVSLSKANFDRERRLTEDPDRIKEPAYFGWLCTRIEVYPDTAALKTDVHTRKVGMRPYVALQATDHPLAIEQRDGITLSRMREIAELMEHGWKHPEWNTKAL